MSQSKPKYIQTDIGTEKYCKGCDEYWPLDKEFFKSTTRKRFEKEKIEYQTLCKCCYKEKYRSPIQLGVAV